MLPNTASLYYAVSKALRARIKPVAYTRSLVTLEVRSSIGVLTLDDSKMNSLSFNTFDALNSSLDALESNSFVSAIVQCGNSKAFSAGFDLKVMTSKDKNSAANLIYAGGLFGFRLFKHKLPVFSITTGHALAMGAILLLCSDFRIGFSSASDKKPFKIGLNEVSINMSLPLMAIEVGKHKMCPSALNQAFNFGNIYSHSEAAAPSIGFLDEVIDLNKHTTNSSSVKSEYEQKLELGLARVEEIMKGIKQPAFGIIKNDIRRDSIKFIENNLKSDCDKYRV